ncbi:MAG: hypothetical protein ACP5J5_02450 [Dissulfurimicrobium sp.]|uniref:hypothetical protein n=1 Tax=Dissulfurimicrobium hydrothermale TaxID=1750598 RepID=UPI001EDC087D|nr:hypothetical protein [Dissulfurimicrobium hydrothermale]UKL13607.1 hypothetical protein LGS26_09095 [Dissulfurimicrobium hydrothermale]
MQSIPISLAAPEMILAKAVKTEDGKILCGPGVELTAELISRLSKSGVHVVVVKGHPVQMPGEKSLAEMIKELEERFAKVKDDPVLRALMRLIAEHIIEEAKT